MQWRKRTPIREPDPFNEVLEQLAAIRGIDDLDEYLSPTFLNSATDPFEMKNMVEAMERIVKAIDEGQNITVFMDFDCDGVCSGVMMVRYLMNFTFGLNLDHLAFQRFSDHGLKNKNIPQTDLLIVVDSGTNDVEECKALQERGIDVVILDHHLPSVKNPYAIIVNNQVGDYSSKSLSGSGVTLKCLQALDSYFGTEYHYDFYDLAAVGIVGDLMNLGEPENRFIVDTGMRHIKNTGIKAIIEKRSVNLGKLTSTDIGFKIAPVINGVTRMNKVEKAVKLLLCEDQQEAEELVEECLGLKEEQNEKQRDIMENLVIDDSHSIIFCIENSLSGNLRGSLANKLAGKYFKPTVMVKLNTETNIYEGSARGFNTASFRDLTIQTGLVESSEGHDNAFGIRIHADNINDFVVKCDELLSNQEVHCLDYDLEFEVKDLDHSFFEAIEVFNRISGTGCSPIKIRVKNMKIGEHKVLGKNRDTISLKGNGLKLIKFSTSPEYAEDANSQIIDAVGTPNINAYQNKYTHRMVIESQVLLDDYQIISKETENDENTNY